MRFNNINDFISYCENLDVPLNELNIEISKDIQHPMNECIGDVCEFVDVKLSFVNESSITPALLTNESVLYVNDLCVDNDVASFIINESKIFTSCKQNNNVITAKLLIEIDGSNCSHEFELRNADSSHWSGAVTLVK